MTGERSLSAGERLGLFVGLIGLVGVLLGVAYLPGETLERRLVDERFLNRSNTPPAHPDLLVVALDEKYSARRSAPEVTSPHYLARVLRTLSRGGARVIALDVAVMEGDTLTPGFLDLQAAVAESPSTVLASVLSVHGARYGGTPRFDLAAEPASALREFAPSGFVTFVDGARPRMRLLARLEDQTLAASFVFRAVQAYLGLLEPAAATWRRDGGSLRIAEPEADSVLAALGLGQGEGGEIDGLRPQHINYVGPVGVGSEIAYLSSEDLLSLYEGNPAFAEDVLGGKLVVVGAMHPAAIDRGFGSPWGSMFGVELQANAINSLLTARLINDGGSAGITVWLSLLAVLCSVGGAIAIVRVRRTDLAALLGAGLALGFPLVLTLVAFSAFDAPDGTLLPMATPLKVWLIVSLSAFAFAVYRGRPAQAPAEMREQHSDSGTGSQPIRDQSSIELVAELRGAREAEPATPSWAEGGSSVTMPEDTSRPARGWGAVLIATALVGLAYISGIGRDKE